MPPAISTQHPVAYFCAEFGFSAAVPIYAGGLGILAGDTIKQAADEGFPMVGLGLLYRGFASQQHLTESGLQVDQDWLFDPLSVGLEHVYVDDMPLFIKVHLTEATVWLRVWKKTFSPTVTLYLLDSDTDQNQLHERDITKILYAGTHESQLKQQLLLGIGGVKLLTALQIHPSLYHVNEGRPAFLHWQLIRELMDTHGIDYESARKLAITKTVYTNHTLVAAGNQGYSVNLLKVYGQYYATKMGVSVEYLLAPGIEADPQVFNSTRFALNVSHKASGVSTLHTNLSQEHWPGYSWVSITNGVHLPTWQDAQLAQQQTTKDIWLRHLELKTQLREYVQAKTGYGYNENALVITWARRLAGYKQLQALFQNLPRFKAILQHAERPIQLLVSGKAHQSDTAGKAMLQEIIHYFQTELSGSALFIPNYSIEVAQHLVKGSDVWLNTPELGMEACGTSGMKALSNGVLQCTVPDGWAAEVDWRDLGWSLNHQDLSRHLYHLLESEIGPLFYTRNAENIPVQWAMKMQQSMALSPQYSAARMLAEYRSQLYT